MKTFRVFSVAIAFFLVSMLVHAGEMRTWTGANGKEIRAEFVSFDGEKVKIRLENGAINTVKLERFSKKDQDFVKNFTPKSKSAKRESEKEHSENLKIGERLFREGRLLCMDGEFEHANTKLTEAVSYDTQSEKEEWRYYLFKTRHAIGILHKNKNKQKPYLDYISKVEAPIPQDMEGISGEFRVEIFRAALAALSFMNLSEIEKDYGEAIEWADKVLKVAPYDLDVKYNRILLLLQTSHDDMAEILQQLKVVRLEEPNFAPAKTLETKIIDAAKNNKKEYTQENLKDARLLCIKHEYEEAVKILSGAINQGKLEMSQEYRFLGYRCVLAIGAKYFNEAMEGKRLPSDIKPPGWVTWPKFTENEKEAEKFDKAINEFGKGYEAFHSEEEFIDGKPKQAVAYKHFDNVLKLIPGDLHSRLWRARCAPIYFLSALSEKERTDERFRKMTIDELNVIIKTEPRFAEAHAALAMTNLLGLGDSKAALKSINEAIRLDPNDTRSLTIKEMILDSIETGKPPSPQKYQR